ncbi:hypothetical protein ACIQZO_39965 [Streptomyces sp. NPDC097617]|uniref:hypothetical protein n=1 Tax=Streptomyces sp. NPDC097617 TaxID=3366091 RepID=UPI0038149C96
MRRTLLSCTAVLALGVAVSMTACTSSNSGAPKVAGADGKSDAQGNQQDPKEVMQAYIKCMREMGWEVKMDNSGHVTDNTPGETGTPMKEAFEECEAKVPGMKQVREKSKPQDLANARGLAKCLRENGISNMADPDGGGLIRPKDAVGGKWDNAVRICEKKFPGIGIGESTEQAK